MKTAACFILYFFFFFFFFCYSSFSSTSSAISCLSSLSAREGQFSASVGRLVLERAGQSPQPPSSRLKEKYNNTNRHENATWLLFSFSLRVTLLTYSLALAMITYCAYVIVMDTCPCFLVTRRRSVASSSKKDNHL